MARHYQVAEAPHMMSEIDFIRHVEPQHFLATDWMEEIDAWEFMTTLAERYPNRVFGIVIRH